MEEDSNAQEAFRNCIMAEITSGGGPELLYDNQFTVSWTPVRRDVLRDRVVESPYDMNLNEKYYLTMKSPNAEGTPIYMDIENKPDGTTYLEESFIHIYTISR